jgi:hypothetical protein
VMDQSPLTDTPACEGAVHHHRPSASPDLEGTKALDHFKTLHDS